MGGEAADLSVQIFQLALIHGLDVGQRIASLKHVRQALEGHLLPVTQDSGVNAILRRELTNGFGFLQQLQHNLGFEGGSVRFFHVVMLPNAGVSAVQILGSTIINVLIVVDDLAAAKAFFVELGMELEGETTVEGPSVDRLIGLQNVRATLALMRTPDGHGRIELDKFHTPEAIRTGPENVPVNALGIRRIMFAVDDIDDVVARLRAHGAELVGEVVQYEDTYRLCYIRGPEGIIVGLAEQLG